ncbi:hypothetical protein C1S82_17910 [Mycolicibacterium cosmeticum]|uniref:Transmembrane anti-sigma factor n=1 Tax=Mycolicibacterium cosmeticum TaxID=258533 RepID=W9BGH7_MYCCO|nr:hypothetical protein [Mycolicibacterium cosmeticum]TLH72678.1 hypothetical protein C1S82_17910 [Mycolicibacterium cosmeticum]CDO05600.1 putative transmembrane anti-sigma factor [Mycolicibacterium cosmeticum]
MSAADHDPSEWDAAYLLGALTPEETVAYERYLADHPDQGTGLDSLAGLPAIMDALPREEALALLGEDAEQAPDLVSLAAAARKRRLRAQRLRVATGIASAAACLIIGGFVGHLILAPQEPAGPALQAMGAGQRAGVTAALAVSAESWGTRLDWQCQYTKDWATTVARYDLVVTTKDGRESTIASWSPSGNEASNLAAATAIPAANIRTVDIRVADTKVPLAVTTLS